MTFNDLKINSTKFAHCRNSKTYLTLFDGGGGGAPPPMTDGSKKADVK